MISNYKFQEDVTDILLEEFNRNGITVEKNAQDKYILSRGRGKVQFGIRENVESGYVYQAVAEFPLPFSASTSLAKEIDTIIKRVGGINSDFFEGILSPTKRKLVRLLYSVHGICVMLLAIMAIFSYFMHGDLTYIFQNSHYGRIISIVLGVGAAVGLFGAHGIFLIHRNNNT